MIWYVSVNLFYWKEYILWKWLMRLLHFHVINPNRPLKVPGQNVMFAPVSRWIPGQTNELCAWRHNMPPPLQVDNIFAFIRQVATVPKFWLLRHQQQVDLWPFDLESGVQVTCDVGYLCANFSLPRPLWSRFRPNILDRRQTDVRQKHRFMPSPYEGRSIKPNNLKT